MKDLMKTNCYDINETMIIVGSCLKSMQSSAYQELEKISSNIYEICLESTHLNMAITKIIGMLSRVKVKKIIFASVDKSPHCIQLHYIENEIQKAMNIKKIEIIHYVAVDNKLIKISENTIKKSKSLADIEKQEKMEKEHKHIILIIKNSKEKYLQYFDKRWESYLFLNCKVEQDTNINQIKKVIEEKLSKETVEINFVYEKIHTKYSESAKKEKLYHHYFYRVKVKDLEDNNFKKNKINYKWYSMKELEQDQRIMQVNNDIISIIKKLSI